MVGVLSGEGGEPQGGRGGSGGEHRLQVGGAVAGVLGPVGVIDRLLDGVVGSVDDDVAFDAAGADVALRVLGRVPVPGAVGAAVGPHVQVVTHTHDPDRHPAREPSLRAVVISSSSALPIRSSSSGVQMVTPPM